MTFEELGQLLNTTEIPFAFHRWEAPPEGTYGVYFDNGSANFFADDAVYLPITGAIVELYTTERFSAEEKTLETALAGFAWEKSPPVYLDDLRRYQISYEFEV